MQEGQRRHAEDFRVTLLIAAMSIGFNQARGHRLRAPRANSQDEPLVTRAFYASQQISLGFFQRNAKAGHKGPVAAPRSFGTWARLAAARRPSFPLSISMTDRSTKWPSPNVPAEPAPGLQSY